MATLEESLNQLFEDAAKKAFGAEIEFDATVRPSKHADFQVNGALGLAKKVGKSPRDVAAELVAAIDDTNGLLSDTEIAGPGFINCKINNTFLANLLTEIADDPHNGIPQATEQHTYVVDYAAPNIAKNMQVWHMRTSIIGDAIVRMLMATNQNVIRQDHQGDWGTQFGMLIELLIDSGSPEETAQASVQDLDAFYKQARVKFDSDEDFARRARERVVLLQSSDTDTLALWNVLISTSREHFQEIYTKLGILLTPEDARGESFYNDMLEDTVAELDKKGLVKEDDGALCVYPEGFKGRDGEPFAMIVRKSDGGYNYATTDLATIRYSVDELKADFLVYVVDARQANHFQQVFAVARTAGWLPDNVTATHVGYGTVLGADGKPFKTRSGESIQLVSLLEEAIDRADIALTDRTTDLTAEERHEIARAVGIAAVKWSDLKNEHSSNYIFDVERMVAFNGNTGPYVQYASTRAKSVLRKAATAPGAIVIAEDAERELALTIAALGTAVERAITHYEPHHVATYTFELAENFTSFYEKCPVLSAADEATKASRLALCALAARTIDAGLNLLGIESVDRM